MLSRYGDELDGLAAAADDADDAAADRERYALRFAMVPLSFVPVPLAHNLLFIGNATRVLKVCPDRYTSTQKKMRAPFGTPSSHFRVTFLII